MTHVSDMLPVFAALPANPGRVTAAANVTVAALEAAGILTDSHALTLATLFTLTDALDTAAANPSAKAYALAGLAAQIRDTLESLPAIAETPATDPWTVLENEIATT